MRKVLVTLALVGFHEVSLGADVFVTSATVGEQAASLGFDSAEAAFDALGETSLSGLLPYSGVEVVVGQVGFRGLPMQLSYPVFNGPVLQLDIPSLGISRAFVGNDRDESLDLLQDFFKRGDELGRIMKELARVSPVDPVAGNPNSLQSRMVAGTYERNFRSVVSKVTALGKRRQVAMDDTRAWKVAAAGSDIPLPERRSNVQSITPSVSVGAAASSYTQSGLRSNSVAVPLAYAFPPDPTRPFSIEAELQYTGVEGAKQYSANLGGSYRLGLTDNWFVIPALNYGFTGSVDLGSSGQMWAASITSAFRLVERHGYTLWMGNGVSYLKSVSTRIEGYRFDPGLSNTAFVNGLVLSTPAPGLASNSWLEFSFSDTRYTGSDLFNQRYDEIGVAIAKSSGSFTSGSYWRLGLTYLNASRSKGGGVNFQASF